MTTMPSQLIDHPPTPWMDLPPTTTTTSVDNGCSDCGNGSLVIDIAPVSVSDGEERTDDHFKISDSNVVGSQESVDGGSKLFCTHVEKYVAENGDCSEKTESDVVEIDLTEELELAEDRSNGVRDASVDNLTTGKDCRDSVVCYEVTVICPDSDDDTDNRPEITTNENSGSDIKPSSDIVLPDPKPGSGFEDTTWKKTDDESLGNPHEKTKQSVSIVGDGNSLGSEVVARVAPENREPTRDLQSEQGVESCARPERQSLSRAQSASGCVTTEEKTGENSVENRGSLQTVLNLPDYPDRTLISYLTNFPLRIGSPPDTDKAPPINLPITEVPPSIWKSSVDSARLNPIAAATSSTAIAPKAIARPSTIRQVVLPSKRTTSDLQFVSHTKQRKRLHSLSSVIPIHVKEEKVDDSYGMNSTSKVQIVGVRGLQRTLATGQPDPVTVRIPWGDCRNPLQSPNPVTVRIPWGNCSNPLQSVVSSSAVSIAPPSSGKLRTMPAYRFSHFRASSPQVVPTSSSCGGLVATSASSLSRFVALYAKYPSRLRSPQPVITTVATPPVLPRYVLNNTRQMTPPSTIQSKVNIPSAPCFILVNQPNPGPSPLAVAPTTAPIAYTIRSSIAPPSSRAKCNVASTGNAKPLRPLKVRPANTNAALLTRKFDRLYRKSILPKLVSPKLMPRSLFVSVPLTTRSCEGCGDEFVTERGLADHYDRKSVIISFTCRCDRKPMMFYNMCSFARFYERHASDRSSQKQHSPHDSCVMAMLPTYLMPAEYHLLAATDDRRKTPAEAAVTTADAKVVQTPPPPTRVGQPGPSIAEFMNALDNRFVNCTECTAVYKRRKYLVTHMSTQRATPKELFRCERCCMVLPNACSFRAHARIHDRVAPYVCPECGLVFRSSREVFMKHVKKACMHFSRFQSRQCPVCSATLSVSASTLVDHLVSAHAALYHKCNICMMAFQTVDSFRGHNVSEHRELATSSAFLKCPICSKTEKNLQSLTAHLSQHMETGGVGQLCSFRCLVCLKNFSARPELIEHMRSAHPDETITGQMCVVCGTVCENGVALYDHTSAEHSEFFERLLRGETDNTPCESDSTDRPTSADAKPTETSNSLECDRCQMVLSDDEQFKRHVAKHRFLEAKRAGEKTSEGKVKKKRRKIETKDVVDGNVQIKSEPATDEFPANPNSSGPSTPIRLSQASSTSPSRLDTELKRIDRDILLKQSWFSCHLCEKAFKNTDDLHQHLKDVHAGKSRQHAYLCWICREQSELKSYPKAGMLIKHLKNFHKIARKNIDYARIVSCGSKDESSVTGDEEEQPVKHEISSSSLVRNLRVEGDASYNCARCEFSAGERGAFLEHVAEHRLHESHQCLECGVCFIALPSLKRHLFAVHRVRDFDRYQTEAGVTLDLPVEVDDSDLDSSFASPSFDSVESSFLSETPGSTSPEKESTTLECTVCYRSFADQWTLRQHMRVHGMAFIQGTRRSNMSRKSSVLDS